MPHHKSIKKTGDKIQSILISKKDYPHLKDAISHLYHIGHNLHNLHKDVDETANYYRFR
jgi:hypothetical protein